MKFPLLGKTLAVTGVLIALTLAPQSEQSALVLGSLLLFAVLGAVMVATRRVDWYALMDQLRREANPPSPKPAQ